MSSSSHIYDEFDQWPNWVTKEGEVISSEDDSMRFGVKFKTKFYESVSHGEIHVQDPVVEKHL